MPRPVLIDPELEEADPEKTLVREDWESAVIRRVAPHVAAVQSAVGEDTAAEARFGWETQTLRAAVASRELASPAAMSNHWISRCWSCWCPQSLRTADPPSIPCPGRRSGIMF